MTEEKEGPVHYQVSVTGRQAAAFFLVLLAALGLSFFFGMKTGAAAKRGPDAVSALAAQSDIPVPPVSEEAGTGGKPTPAPTEAPIGFAPGAGAKEHPAAAKPEPTAVEEPKPVVRELRPAEGGAAAAAPAPARESAKEPAKESAAKKEDGPFWVQILVTSSPRKADELSKKLKGDGFRPDVSVVPGRAGLFRVRVGPFPDRAKAEAAARKAGKVEKLQTKPIVVPGK